MQEIGDLPGFLSPSQVNHKKMISIVFASVNESICDSECKQIWTNFDLHLYSQLLKIVQVRRHFLCPINISMAMMITVMAMAMVVMMAMTKTMLPRGNRNLRQQYQHQANWPMGKQSFAPGVNVAFSPHMYNVQTNKIPNVPALVLVLEGRHSNGNKDCEVARGKVWPGGLQWFTT